MHSSSTDIRLSNDIRYDISVVIVSYNTREMTIDCVQSVIDHSGDITVQIIVVDNCSSDGSAAALREKFNSIMVIDSPANGGFSYGNNIGFEQAKGRYILLLNPDTQIFSGGLEQSVSLMDANQNVGIMGPYVRLENGKQQSSMIRFLSLTQLFFAIFLPGKTMRKTSILGDPRYANLSTDVQNKVDAVSGCFMLVRRTVIDEVGGLDTRFFMYGEETEWCHRVGRSGWDIIYNPDVEILHHGAGSTSHMSEWQAIEIARGHLLFLRFTRGEVIARIGALLLLVRDIVRIPYFIPLFAIKGFKPIANMKPWWARLKFISVAFFQLPKGQNIALPDPQIIAEKHP